MTEPGVRHGLAADEEPIAETLRRAFATDPVMIWLFPNEPTRPDALRTFFRVVTAAFRPHGHTYVIEADGAALWSPPDVRPDLSGMAEVFAEHIAEDRREEVAAQFRRLGEHRPDEPHFYLQAIGVDDHARGQGLGARLLRHVLGTCDDTGLTAHLESSNPRNISLYERHGFETTAELEFAPGVIVRPMQRSPRR